MARSSERGQILVMAAMMMVVLVGVVALAVDLGQIYVVRRSLQNAADVAALVGSVQLPDIDDAENAAEASASANLPPRDTVDAVVPPITPRPDGSPYTTDYIEVTVSEEVPHLYAVLFGRSSSTVGATAIARLSTSPGGRAALVALDENNDYAIQAFGAGELAVSGGDVWSNDGICAGNFSSITTENGGTVLAVGGVQTRFPCLGPVGPVGDQPGTSIGDPLAGLAPPACGLPQSVPDHENSTESGWIVMRPGTYASINMQTSKNYKLVKGVYCVSGNVNLAGRRVVGVDSDAESASDAFSDPTAPDGTHPWGGVTFYLNGGSSQQFTLNGNTVAKLAPDYQNVLIWMVDGSDLNRGIQLNGNANTRLYGTIYAPKAQAQIIGNYGNNGSLLQGSLIAKDTTFFGNSTVTIVYDEDYAHDPRKTGTLVR